MEKVVGAVVLMLVMVFVLALLGAIVTQYAWDHSIAEIFKLPEISFFQAFCLNLFGGMVFKSSGSSSK
jgi:uncharacterized membrane protein